ncbi:MAG: putative ABC transport system permease protein [Patescibacteria group bacterium]|jgi:putative ABC transport system permease protein
MITDYIQLSFKNLKHRGIRSWLTLLGICIGVMAVVALIGLGEGLQTAVNSQFGISSTEVISVQAGGLSFGGPPGTGVTTPLTIKDMRALEGINNIDLILRRNLETSQVEFNKNLIITSSISMPDGEGRDFAYELLNIELVKGKLLEDGDSGEVLVGNNFYTDKMGFDRSIDIGDNLLIQGEKFKIIGIAEKKGSFIFDNIIYMNQANLDDLYDYGDEVDVIGIKVKDADKMQRTKEDIEKKLRKSRNVKEGEEDFRVETPQAALETVGEVLQAVTIFVGLIALISVFVGSIGIVNTMTTSVVERKKEIGIMKAVGAKNSQVFMQFFIEAGMLGAMGGILGIVLGNLISILGTIGINNWIGAEVPISFNLLVNALAFLGSFTIGAIAGVTPALSAAKQDPVEALRG